MQKTPLLPLVLVTLACLAPLSPAGAQETAGFGALRAELERTLKGYDLNEREGAIAQFARAGGIEAVRQLLRSLDSNGREILQLRTQLARQATATAEAQAEVNRVRGLVNAKRAGERTLALRTEELEQATALQKQTTERLGVEEATSSILRKAVGWAIALCEGRDLDAAAGLVRQAYQRSRDVADRAGHLKTMVWVDHPALQGEVAGATRDAFEPIRVAALEALEERGGLRALEPALAAMQDPVWQVRAAAIRVLRTVGGRKACAALVKALELEDGRLATDAMLALRQLTGRNFHDNPHLWRNWLEQEGGHLQEPTDTANAPPVKQPEAPGGRGEAAAAGRKGTGFYGINSKTKHPVFVIDYSGSMGATISGQALPEGTSSGPAKIGGPRRVDGVATELVRFIESLPKDGTFNIVLFDHRIFQWRDKMQPATRENKDAARSWLLERGPEGATDLFGGIEKAFEFAGRGSFDKHYAVGMDTIFLLSDGSPTAGRVQNTDEILSEVRKLNNLKRISIHCVALGRQLNARFLRQLAEENDGEFTQITR